MITVLLLILLGMLLAFIGRRLLIRFSDRLVDRLSARQQAYRAQLRREAAIQKLTQDAVAQMLRVALGRSRGDGGS